MIKLSNFRLKPALPLALSLASIGAVHASENAESLLADVHVGTRVTPHAVVDAGVVQGWIELNRAYNIQRDFGQLDRFEQRAHIEQVQNYQKGLMIRLRDRKLTELAQSAQKGIEQSPGLKQVGSAMGLAIAAYEVSRGRELRYRLGEQSQLTARTVVRQQTASLGFSTPWISSGLGASLQGRDRLTTSIARTVAGVRASLSLGLQSRTMLASLSRDLFAGISGSVERSQGKGTQSEHTVRLSYGIGF